MHGRTTSAIRSDRTPAPLLPRFTSPLFLALIVGLSSCGDGGTTTSEPEAVFFTLLVELAGHGEGTVTSQPAGIACGPEADQCQASFEEGTAVNLSAAPEERSEFLGWSGPCSGGGSCSLTMTGDASLGAEFDNPFLEVEEVGPAGGTVVSSDGQLTLEIPEGALSQGVEITVEALEPEMLGAEFGPVAEQFGIAEAYEFGPSGLTFEEPVTVSTRLDDAVRPSEFEGGGGVEFDIGFFVASDGTTLEAVSGMELVADAEAGTLELRGELSHFSSFAVTADESIGGFAGAFPCLPTVVLVEELCTAQEVIRFFHKEGINATLTGFEWVDGTGPPLVHVATGPVVELGDSSREEYTETLFAGPLTYRCVHEGSGVPEGVIHFTVLVGAFTSANIQVPTDGASPTQCVNRHTLTVNITGEGQGRVTSDPEGIDCHSSGGDCEADYGQFTRVDLTAEPDEGSVFVAWVDADGEVIETSATERVTITEDGTVWARFDPADDDDGETDSDEAPRVTQLRATVQDPVTTYEVHATDPAGGDLSYEWTMDAREGYPHENCGTPQVPWTQEGQSVAWSHSSEAPDDCEHDVGTDHAVDLTVTVTSDESGLAVRCEMLGSESQTIDLPECDLVEPPDQAPRVTQLRATLQAPVTTYEVHATDPAGGTLFYDWTMVAREGYPHENCGTPQVPWTQENPSVTWRHDNCEHVGTNHAVDLTVTVWSSASGLAVRCEMFGSESQTIDNPGCEMVESQDGASAEAGRRSSGEPP